MRNIRTRYDIIRKSEAGNPTISAIDGVFGQGILTAAGDTLDNTITFGRDAAGRILLNGGAVAIRGGVATVANTGLIQAFGQGGNDVIAINEASGALPRANLFGGAGNDALTGGSGGDMLFGQSGNDSLFGKGGADFLFGGADNDVLTGGDGDDQMFGEAGNDRAVWNAGDDTDLFEGGAGTDTAEVNGGNGAERFSTTANGTRVRFDRLDPAPFALDIGTTETLVVNMNGGNDSFSAIGNLATLIQIIVDGGAGDDFISAGNGVDLLLGGDGNDFIDGQQGNDVALLGAGDDLFQWDPGDGNDVIEGQSGLDTLRFNGSGAGEIVDISANGGRARLFRNVANILTDLNDVETLRFNAFGGPDTINVGDLSGTDVTRVEIDLAAAGGGGDAQPDLVAVSATKGADAITITGSGSGYAVGGLSALVTATGSEAANDALVVNALDGSETISAATLAAGIVRLTLDGGAGNDTILGSLGGDILIGGDGDDRVIGNKGDDAALLGAGDDLFEWNPGDGNDLIEGGGDFDTLRVFGSNLTEAIGVSANGGRVRVLRDVGSVALDVGGVEQITFVARFGSDSIAIGDMSGTGLARVNVDLARYLNGAIGDNLTDTVSVAATQGNDDCGVSSAGGDVSVFGLATETRIVHAEGQDALVLSAGAGADLIDASSLAAGRIRLSINGGLGDDVMLGSFGDDVVNGGDGLDQAQLGDGDDLFLWNPGDDNDVVEGGAGYDRLMFSGSGAAENVTIGANAGRVALFRDVANVIMDLNDTEALTFNGLGGPDTISIGDLTGTDLVQIDINLAGTLGGGDGSADTIIVNGTHLDDAVVVIGDGGQVSIIGLTARIDIAGFEAGLDRLIINGLGGGDLIDASGLTAAGIKLTAEGGDGDDVLVGGDGNDVLLGGLGDDALFGGSGIDLLDGGAGDNVVVQGDFAPLAFVDLPMI